MSLSDIDWPAHLPALWLSLKLAVLTTAVLLPLAMPLAWWLGTTRSVILRPILFALFVLPLAVPPAALAAWLLQLLSLSAPIMHIPLGFPVLLVAAIAAAIPLAVLPMSAAFSRIPPGALIAARTLGAGRWTAFRTVALPMARLGILAAAALTFVHSLGAFSLLSVLAPGNPRLLTGEIIRSLDTGDTLTAQGLAAALAGGVFLILVLVSAITLKGTGQRG